MTDTSTLEKLNDEIRLTHIDRSFLCTKKGDADKKHTENATKKNVDVRCDRPCPRCHSNTKRVKDKLIFGFTLSVNGCTVVNSILVGIVTLGDIAHMHLERVDTVG